MRDGTHEFVPRGNEDAPGGKDCARCGFPRGDWRHQVRTPPTTVPETREALREIAAFYPGHTWERKALNNAIALLKANAQ